MGEKREDETEPEQVPAEEAQDAPPEAEADTPAEETVALPVEQPTATELHTLSPAGVAALRQAYRDATDEVGACRKRLTSARARLDVALDNQANIAQVMADLHISAVGEWEETAIQPVLPGTSEEDGADADEAADAEDDADIDATATYTDTGEVIEGTVSAAAMHLAEKMVDSAIERAEARAEVA